jgi:hypothetical protein
VYRNHKAKVRHLSLRFQRLVDFGVKDAFNAACHVVCLDNNNVVGPLANHMRKLVLPVVAVGQIVFVLPDLDPEVSSLECKTPTSALSSLA